MPKFALAYPYFIIMLCLVVAVVGVTPVARMPVDLFPQINIPVVVVATFYSGMPPQDIETDITDPLERFFTLASGIDHNCHRICVSCRRPTNPGDECGCLRAVTLTYITANADCVRLASYTKVANINIVIAGSKTLTG